jgi:methionine biosynthesis protein MetW
MSGQTTLRSPDASSRGLLKVAPDPARYGGQKVEDQPTDRFEVPGIMHRWMPERVRVLDIGCGTGAITIQSNFEKSNQVLCVEPDADRAAIAASRGLNVVQGLADEELLQERGPFDVIVFSDVLEHLVAPADLLDLASTALAPGGIILASVPNVAHWTVRAKLLFGRFDYDSVGIMDATHLRWFTRRSIRSLFEEQGYTVSSIVPTSGAWMGVYQKFPFRLIPARVRPRLVASLANAFPTIFGCQYVIRAHRT